MQTSRSKSKSDSQSKNDGIIDWLLFTRHYVIETEHTPEEVLESIKYLVERQSHNHLPSNLKKRWGILRLVDVQLDQNQSGDTFGAFALQHALAEPTNIALVNATGNVVYSKGYGKTLVYLEVKLSRFYLAMIIGSLLIGVFLLATVFLSDKVVAENITALIMMPFVYIALFYMLFSERNKLKDTIENAIHSTIPNRESK